MTLNKKIIEWHFIFWISLVLIMPLIPIHKIIFTSIFLVYSINCLLKKEVKFVIKTNSPLFIAVIFIYGEFIASFSEFDFEVSNQLLSSIAVLFLFYIIYDSKIDYNKVLLISAYLFSITSIWLGIEGYFFKGGIITNIVAPYNLLSLDERNIGFGDILYSRLISLPVVFVAFAQLLFQSKFKKKTNYIGIILFSIVILISFTRALIFCWLFLILFTMIYKSSVWKKIFAFTVFILAVLGILASGTLSVNEASNKTKLQDVNNFIIYVSKNNNILLKGDGLGSYFYRKGKGYYAKTENTILDFIRYFGIPLTLLIMIMLFFPFNFKINKKSIYFMFSFFLYVIMSLSNPTLFNSFGCISILWYWYNISVIENS